MAKVHGLPFKNSPLFWHSIKLEKSAPHVFAHETKEIDPPYRVSTSLVLRLIGSRGIVIGWWKESGLDEWEALMKAIEGNTDVKAIDDSGVLVKRFRG